MKRTGGLAVLAVVAAMVAAGCGGGGGSTGQADSGWLLSNQKVDGSIGFTPLPLPGTYQNYTATSTGNVVFGLNANGTGYRAFMDFPLDGSAGGASVPAGASIQLATLSVFVGNVSLSSTVPTLLELVSFPVTGPTPADYDSPSLKTLNPFSFYDYETGNFVVLEVTPLMAEAQRLKMRNLQLRFRLDNTVAGAAGVVTLTEGTSGQAPILTVAYD